MPGSRAGELPHSPYSNIYSNNQTLALPHRPASSPAVVEIWGLLTSLCPMDVVAVTFASGWASGLNAYATVFLLGMIGRFGGIEGIPDGFQRTDVLILMGVLALVEFVADKIPYLDTAWDAISTFIRPAAGALIGAMLAGANGDVLPMTLSALGGVTALVSHAARSGLRLAINTSPEPFSNVTASLVGDLSLLTVVSLAVAYPVQAAVLAAILLALTITLVLLLLAQVRRGIRAFRARFAKTA